MSKWQDLGAGIAVWTPAETETDEISPASTAMDDSEEREHGSQPTLPSKDSVEANLRTNLQTEQLKQQESFYTPDRSASASASEYTPATSQANTLLPSAKEGVVSQLTSCSTPSSPLSSSPDQFDSPPDRRSTATSPTELYYDSDRTDFLEYPETPCPQRGPRTKPTRRPTDRSSHHFRKSAVTNRERSVRRRLEFGLPTVSKKSSSHQRSAAMVRPPEYSPSHMWSKAEDEMLCVLWRFYNRQRKDYASVLNAYFNLDLSFSKVDNRFYNYLRLHGPRAIRVYNMVFSAPFHNPGHYNEVMSRIDQTASSLGMVLNKLSTELKLESGQARFAKSPQTRRIYRSLVRKAAKETYVTATQLFPQEKIRAAPLRFGHVIRTEAEADTLELFTDDEDAPCDSSTSSGDGIPHLAFRVWDESSRSKFSEEDGFVSEGFSLWNGDLMPPPQGEFSQVLLNNHLSVGRGGTSFWISVSTSLLQCLTKAANMKRPQIAIIALDFYHPARAGAGRILWAKEVLSHLRSQNQALWTRRYKGYKGHAEHMIWGRVERASIIRNLPIANLLDLFDRCDHVKNLLHLPVFVAGQRTAAISKQLQLKGTTFNASAGSAIGQLALMLGLSKPQHISALCGRLVDGWLIKETTASETESCAWAFASVMSSRLDGRQAVDVFTSGIKDGMKQLRRWQKRR